MRAPVSAAGQTRSAAARVLAEDSLCCISHRLSSLSEFSLICLLLVFGWVVCFLSVVVVVVVGVFLLLFFFFFFFFFGGGGGGLIRGAGLLFFCQPSFTGR